MNEMKSSAESDCDLQTTNEQSMNTTNEQMGRFDWHEFSEGRARFIGGVRGPDELGHDGFVIEAVGFPAMHGEIRRRSAANKNDYDLEIVACG